MSNNNTSNGGLGLFGLLTVLFVGLKLASIIAWPWIWVLSPLWIPSVIAVFGLIGALVFAGLVALSIVVSEKVSKKKKK